MLLPRLTLHPSCSNDVEAKHRRASNGDDLDARSLSLLLLLVLLSVASKRSVCQSSVMTSARKNLSATSSHAAIKNIALLQ